MQSSLIQTGNHADFHQFVGTRPYVYYYHLWLLQIPHLSFLAVPQLSADVFRLSCMADGNNEGQDDLSISSNDEIFNMVPPPPTQAAGLARKMRGTPSNIGRPGSGTPGQGTVKTSLLQSHLQSLEKYQSEAAQQRKGKDERDQQLARTMELQAVEEMLAMKKRELKAFDSDVDSESEKEFVCKQIKKLRKKQRSLTLLVCGGSDDDESS
jgi:hypothetical protein